MKLYISIIKRWDSEFLNTLKSFLSCSSAVQPQYRLLDDKAKCKKGGQEKPYPTSTFMVWPASVPACQRSIRSSGWRTRWDMNYTTTLRFLLSPFPHAVKRLV